MEKPINGDWWTLMVDGYFVYAYFDSDVIERN